MKVSIITVAYNSAKTIQKTFESVKNQFYTNIEYIVVDGGSTDDTVSLIKSNKDIITKWVSEPDEGLYFAMNKGITMATGDIIGILNSDDTFKDSKVIHKIVDFHRKNDIDASIGDVEIYNSKGQIKRKFVSKNWLPWKLKWGLMPPHPSIFVKFTVFENFGNFDTQFKIGADFEIITRWFLKNQITWKYSGITTTAMLEGGLSDGGLISYIVLSKEDAKALIINDIRALSFLPYFRCIFKLKSFFV